jgi:RHS repeat-associated protein
MRLFTGKERDQETGLDYFGARYLSSAQGRWTSPDLVNLTNERQLSPNSTLNKYAYAANNPLKFVDPDGKDIVVLYGNFMPISHMMVAAYNEERGDFALLSVGPQEHSLAAVLRPREGVPGTTVFQLDATLTADDFRRNYTALTITTSPEIAQEAIDLIRAGAGTGNWAWRGNNCASSTAKLLADIGIDPGWSLLPWFPASLWESLYHSYGTGASIVWWPGGRYENGRDYGRPRFGIDTFYWLEMMLKAPVRAVVTVTVTPIGEAPKKPKEPTK